MSASKFSFFALSLIIASSALAGERAGIDTKAPEKAGPFTVVALSVKEDANKAVITGLSLAQGEGPYVKQNQELLVPDTQLQAVAEQICQQFGYSSVLQTMITGYWSSDLLKFNLWIMDESLQVSLESRETFARRFAKSEAEPRAAVLTAIACLK